VSRRLLQEPDGIRARSLGEVLEFLQLLWSIGHGLESISKRMRTTIGITGPQRLVIRLIGRYGTALPGDLAAILRVDPSSLTGVLRRLQHAKLVRRTPDPEDRRRALLTLTPRGRVLNVQHAGTVESSVRRTLRGVSPEQAASVRAVLQRLARELDVERAVAPTRPPGRAKALRRRKRTRA
jgi:MarR family transcriptional regulator, organic hydroperoxide resistance regulator